MPEVEEEDIHSDDGDGKPKFTKPDQVNEIDRGGRYCEGEDREVLERLRGLGYID